MTIFTVFRIWSKQYYNQGLVAILATISKNIQRMILESIPLDLTTEQTLEKIAYAALYVAYNSKYL